jgi:hypothetical protein
MARIPLGRETEDGTVLRRCAEPTSALPGTKLDSSIVTMAKVRMTAARGH